jgi:DNA-binding FadR family transcriptional regulator
VLDQLFKSHEFDGLLGDEKNRPEVRRIVADSCDAHQEIADAFRAGDSSAMTSAAERHLASVEKAMLDNLV